MKNWKVILLVIIGLAITAKVINYFLEKDINKTLDEIEFDYNDILSNYDTLPSEFKSELIENSFLSKEEFQTQGYNLNFLVPKNWINVEPYSPEIYRKHSDIPDVRGVFSITLQNIENTFLDEDQYINAWKAQLDGVGTNSEILNTKHLNSKTIEIILIESSVYVDNIKKTSMIHCHYALKDISFSISFYSNFDYYLTHQNEIDKCVRSLRINPI